MNWSMPRPALQWVAVLLAAISVGSLVLGALTAPGRSHLPGEVIKGAGGQPLQAQDATPFTDERIEGAPLPVALTDEEKAKLEADKLAKAEAAALTRAEAEKGAPAGPEAVVAAAAAPTPAEKVESAEKPPPPKDEEPLF